MKIKSFAKISTAFWLALGITATITQHGEAATATFFSRGSSEVYVDLNKYLNSAIAESGISPISQVTAETTNTNRPKLEDIFKQANPTQAVTAIEQRWEREYEDYFGSELSANSLKAEEIANRLGKLASKTGKKPALVYVVPTPKQLELVLVLPDRKPIRKSIPSADRPNLLAIIEEFRKETVNPNKTNTTSYKSSARKLYDWIIAPLEPDLKTNSIDTLLFCVGSGLRSIPLAALHDGQKFLVEKYSIGLIPAFNMTDSVYRDIKNSPVLAMGASQFTDKSPLAAVPVELSAIMKDLSGVLWPGPWRGKTFLNQEFTVDNLKSQRASQPFGIVHLATHAEFKSGAPGNSYIQFWDSKLGLDKMRQLRWNQPPVDLLVLSACRTALGDKDAEMGFAGLAIQSGVKSALASLWNVSDEGTLALMAEFYQQLRVAPIRTEALRQAQIAMIRGQLRLSAGELRGSLLGSGVKLPPELAELGNKDFSHPYYWAAFTMIGNPW
jgi:CHAT domain-containing protein